MNDRIQAAAQDPRNGSIAAIRSRFYKTGSPFKKEDKRVKLFVNGKPAVEVAQQNGVSKARFYQRIVRYGWTPEQAVKNQRVRYDLE